MASRTITVSIEAAPAVAFAFLEDFTHAAGWDPGVAAAERLDDGPITLGSRFGLDLLVAGRTQRWTYVVERHDAPTHVTFATRTGRATGMDAVQIAPRAGGGSEVTWSAAFTFAGMLGRIVDPAFSLVFGRIVEKAVSGLEDALRQLPAEG